MNINSTYDSRNSFYRNPMGAVEEDTDIHFTIVLPRDLGCYCAQLMIKHDTEPDFTFHSMFWCGMYGDDYEMWDCHFKTDKIGLYWHIFRLKTNQGDRFVNPAGPKHKSVIDRSPALPHGR